MKKLLSNIDIQDKYDIKYTQGAESTLKKGFIVISPKNKVKEIA